MPFGVSNAPAVFQRTMDLVLSGLKFKCCMIYMDDIVIYSKTFEQHMLDLSDVFGKLRAANIHLKASKCRFACSNVLYLGYQIGKDRVRPNPEKTKAIVDFPKPGNKKETKRFLGMILMLPTRSLHLERNLGLAKLCVPLKVKKRKMSQNLIEENQFSLWGEECNKKQL